MKEAKEPAIKKKFEFRLNLNFKRLAIWLLIIFLFVPEIIAFFGKKSGVVAEIPLTEAVTEIKNGKVERVEVRGDEVALFYPIKGGSTDPVLKITRKEENSSFIEPLQREGVDSTKIKVEISSLAFTKILAGILSFALPILGFGLLMLFMM